MLSFLRDKRRQKILAVPAPERWEEIIDRNVPHSRLLNDAEWEELLRHTQVMAAEKRFEGCGGLEITEEIRVTIAAWGALLLVNRDTDYYPELTTILVYPAQFVVPVRKPLGEGAELAEEEVRLGESIGDTGPGTIVLAWDEVMKCAGDWSDGVNVAVHEFAHRLDQEDGLLNGVPAIADPVQRERWMRVFESEYEALEKAEERFGLAEEAEVLRGGDPADETDAAEPMEPLLDPYALTSPAEFFAVVCETFFEWPKDLEKEHPLLYGVMRDFFRQDPALRWRQTEAGGVE